MLNLVLIDCVAIFRLIVGVVKLKVEVLHVLCDTVYLYFGLVDGAFWISYTDRVYLTLLYLLCE